MNLGNDRIEAGDEVYDLLRKSGIVVKVDEIRNQLIVRFGSTAEAYDTKGIALRSNNKVRTLYWANPLMFDPPKNSTKWRVLRNLTLATANVIFGSDLSELEAQDGA